tara:strand:- start:76 stop:1836 length:1761 start_codon:yes stop_codon:yes gene_type:complete
MKMNNPIIWLFNQSRQFKRLFSLVLDSLFLSLAFWFAFMLRLEDITLLNQTNHWQLLACVLPITLMCFVKLGLYHAILRYISLKAVATMLSSIIISAMAMIVSAYYLNVSMPRTIPIIYSILALLLCGGARICARALFSQSNKCNKAPIIVYGAGSAGRQLFTSLQGGQEYRVVAFIDDDKSLQNITLHGIYISSPKSLPSLIKQYSAKKVLLAMPSVAKNQRHQLLKNLKVLNIELLTLPCLADIVSGRAKISELKQIRIDELLGRSTVTPFSDLMHANIKNKVVMVSGAGGSIGSELCRQILSQQPKHLVLFELNEFALYNIHQELLGAQAEEQNSISITPILSSVLDQEQLERVMTRFSVQTIYHTAAYKHVPLVEYNVISGVRNNVFGTLRAARAAQQCGVETFVLISTDKAVRPTNVMGASKRLAELVLQGLSLLSRNTTFCMVRFGNVLGSSGSVIPLFKKQIKAGGPVTITHQEVTRYFMSISEAAQLVIQAGAMGQGGDVFVLDMGKPVLIKELAENMIQLMGLTVKTLDNPNGDIEIKVCGLRPGEKLYEELLIGTQEKVTSHPPDSNSARNIHAMG